MNDQFINACDERLGSPIGYSLPRSNVKNDPLIKELLDIRGQHIYIIRVLENLLEAYDERHERSYDDPVYKTAWLTRCNELNELLTLFATSDFNKREKLRNILDKTIKSFNNDVDIKIHSDHLEKDASKDMAIMNHVNALGNGLAEIKKKSEVTETAITTFGKELIDIKNYLQNEMIPAIIRLNQVVAPQPQQPIEQPQTPEQDLEVEVIRRQNRTTPDGKVILENNTQPKNPLSELYSELYEQHPRPNWTDFVDEVSLKMKENNWDIYEVCKRANIAYGSFRKFERKSQKLSKATVNKILELFNITY